MQDLCLRLSLFLVMVWGRDGVEGYFMPSILRLVDIPLELPDHPPIFFCTDFSPLSRRDQDVLALGVAGGSTIFPLSPCLSQLPAVAPGHSLLRFLDENSHENSRHFQDPFDPQLLP